MSGRSFVLCSLTAADKEAKVNLSLLCIVAAIVFFALATAGIGIGVPLVPLGLALFAAGHLPLP